MLSHLHSTPLPEGLWAARARERDATSECSVARPLIHSPAGGPSLGPPRAAVLSLGTAAAGPRTGARAAWHVPSAAPTRAAAARAPRRTAERPPRARAARHGTRASRSTRAAAARRSRRLTHDGQDARVRDPQRASARSREGARVAAGGPEDRRARVRARDKRWRARRRSPPRGLLSHGPRSTCGARGGVGGSSPARAHVVAARSEKAPRARAHCRVRTRARRGCTYGPRATEGSICPRVRARRRTGQATQSTKKRPRQHAEAQVR